MLYVMQENCAYQLFKSLVRFDEEIDFEPKCTDYEEDAITGRLLVRSHRTNVFHSPIIELLWKHVIILLVSLIAIVALLITVTFCESEKYKLE